jgi:hypothetical protein
VKRSARSDHPTGADCGFTPVRDVASPLGPDLERTNPAAFMPEPKLGRSDRECVSTLMSWRCQPDGDEAWTLDSHLFNAEMLVIRNRLEKVFRTE